MNPTEHRYLAQLRWVGARDEPWSYVSYSRSYAIRVPGKPELAGSADPAFRGDSDAHNPEDLFLAAISGCHLLAYLALCARRGLRVLRYVDDASAELALDPGGGGRLTSVELRPTVTIPLGMDPALAESLHATAHQRCFIANSCRVPIQCHPQILVDTDDGGETE